MEKRQNDTNKMWIVALSGMIVFFFLPPFLLFVYLQFQKFYNEHALLLQRREKQVFSAGTLKCTDSEAPSRGSRPMAT